MKTCRWLVFGAVLLVLAISTATLVVTTPDTRSVGPVKLVDKPAQGVFSRAESTGLFVGVKDFRDSDTLDVPYAADVGGDNRRAARKRFDNGCASPAVVHREQHEIRRGNQNAQLIVVQRGKRFRCRHAARNQIDQPPMDRRGRLRRELLSDDRAHQPTTGSSLGGLLLRLFGAEVERRALTVRRNCDGCEEEQTENGSRFRILRCSMNIRGSVWRSMPAGRSGPWM